MGLGDGSAAYVCVTCGVQMQVSAIPPESCPICDDERQYVGHDGQRWTTSRELNACHEQTIVAREPDLYALLTQPRFAIGQNPLIVRTADGNIMWDCTSVLTDRIVEEIGGIGGIAAIAISHPHFYGAMVDWSHAFDGAPVYLPRVDREHVMRTDPVLQFWDGHRQALPGGVSIVRCGGHFDGASVLHWPAGAGGRGVLLSSDTIAVGEDRRSVSVMRSYPNMIPIGPIALRAIEAALADLSYDRIYGGWDQDVIDHDATAIVARSIARYRAAIAG